MNNRKQKRGKRRFTIPFTLLGLAWGIASFIFLISQLGKEVDASWIMYIIFLPAGLDIIYIYVLQFFLSFLGTNFPKFISSVIGFFLFFAPAIFFGLLLGRLIGITIDSLIALLKPIENDDE